MACPICGANCKCKKRGPDGMCCSCHRHKVSKKLKADFLVKVEGLEGDALRQKFLELHGAQSQIGIEK